MDVFLEETISSTAGENSFGEQEVGEFGDMSVNVREEENDTLGGVNNTLVSNKIFGPSSYNTLTPT